MEKLISFLFGGAVPIRMLHWFSIGSTRNRTSPNFSQWRSWWGAYSAWKKHWKTNANLQAFSWCGIRWRICYCQFLVFSQCNYGWKPDCNDVSYWIWESTFFSPATTRKEQEATTRQWSFSGPMSAPLLLWTFRKQPLKLLLIVIWSIWLNIRNQPIERVDSTTADSAVLYSISVAYNKHNIRSS